jgi:hypothetical protein
MDGKREATNLSLNTRFHKYLSGYFGLGEGRKKAGKDIKD